MMAQIGIEAAERGWVPDRWIRRGIRSLLDERLTDLRRRPVAANRFLEAMATAPLAVDVDAANRQHYEVPAAFFEAVLGPYLKYSCGLWETPHADLEEAERAMLDRTVDAAGVEDGMQVLDLGCGWGSLSFRMAERFPNLRITAVSNSRSQRRFIEARCARLGIRTIEVLTGDVSSLPLPTGFHRILSVEMFEHVRNHRELLRRLRHAIRDDGRLLVHVFCHRTTPYLFESGGAGDWMAEHFFTGGMMPAAGMMASASPAWRAEGRWAIAGTHYARTLRAWLERLDAHREHVLSIFEPVYGQREAVRWLHRWRLFFMACEELFAYNGGEEWFLEHTLLAPVGRESGS